DGYNYDGNAHAFASTYHSGIGTPQMYAMHPTEPAKRGGRPQYHMTQVRGFMMTDNRDTYLAGKRAY
ncbi:hypothetical protein K469DRAFT_611349, partial [Zopfia rhizophila CBS 207.26]